MKLGHVEPCWSCDCEEQTVKLPCCGNYLCVAKNGWKKCGLGDNGCFQNFCDQVIQQARDGKAESRIKTQCPACYKEIPGVEDGKIASYWKDAMPRRMYQKFKKALKIKPMTQEEIEAAG